LDVQAAVVTASAQLIVVWQAFCLVADGLHVCAIKTCRRASRARAAELLGAIASRDPRDVVQFENAVFFPTRFSLILCREQPAKSIATAR
jgi:hypothetical protein